MNPDLSNSDSKPLRTAVAFLVYNRPELTRQVFAKIREAKPPILLVVADGPKAGKAGDAERCQEVRDLILQGVDWECDLRMNFSEQNLGCRERISSGLDWVFKEVPEAIVLEDDCLPEPSFFRYCEELLERYRTEETIQHIGGCNPLVQEGVSDTYLYSRYNRIWGWASWRRAWKNFDASISFWPGLKERGKLEDYWPEKVYQHYCRMFDACHSGSLDTWDYQWLLCRSMKGLAIVPGVNLVKNIGYRTAATHKVSVLDPFTDMKTGNMCFPLKENSVMVPDEEHDTKWGTFIASRKSLWGRIAYFLRHRRKGMATLKAE